MDLIFEGMTVPRPREKTATSGRSVHWEEQEELQKELKEKARIFMNVDTISVKERRGRGEFLEERRVRRIAQWVPPGEIRACLQAWFS